MLRSVMEEAVTEKVLKVESRKGANTNADTKDTNADTKNTKDTSADTNDLTPAQSSEHSGQRGWGNGTRSIQFGLEHSVDVPVRNVSWVPIGRIAPEHNRIDR
jgi:hypothetical protein